METIRRRLATTRSIQHEILEEMAQHTREAVSAIDRMLEILATHHATNVSELPADARVQFEYLQSVLDRARAAHDKLKTLYCTPKWGDA